MVEIVTPADPARRRVGVLVDLGKSLARPLGLGDLLRTVYEQIARAMDASIVIFCLYDEPSGTVRVVKQLYDGVETAGGSFPLGKGFTSEAIRSRQPRLIRNWSAEGPRVGLQYSSGEAKLPESGLTVPFTWGDRVIGVVLVQSYRPDAYDEDDLLMLEAIAGQLAVALENWRHSEHLNAQLERRVSELEVVLASMADALLILDANGCIVHLNPAARELLCVGEASVVLGQPLDDPRWQERPPGPRAIAAALAPAVTALRAGEERREVEAELQAERRLVLSYSCSPLRDESGQVVGGVLVFRDVTGRREVERLKDEVLSIAAHDLRTPLTAMRARAQLLGRKAAIGTGTPEEMAKGLDGIIFQVDRLTGLLNLLLDFSRIEAGRLEMEHEPTDLVGIAQTVIADVQAATAGAPIHRLVLTAPSSVDVTCDPRRLEQVLQNLVANAVKYSPEGGTVEVRIESNDGTVTVRVRDEGLGLAPEELPLLFDRFYRASGGRSLAGNGLGLYICRAIVAAHGGRIWAESAGPGQGSTFSFTLPAG